jgi:DNA repair exonuclease SbcCD ATPase subunit
MKLSSGRTTKYNMNKFYEIEFISVVNEGETFTFEQLFSMEDNQKNLTKFLDEEVNSKKEELKSQIRSELDQELKREKQMLQAEARNEIEKRVLEEQSKFSQENAELKAQLSKFEEMKNELVSSKDETIKDLKQTIETVSTKFEKDTSSFELKIESQRQSFEEALKTINEQVEKRILDAVTKEREENTKKRTSAVKIGDIGEDQIRDTLKQLFPQDTITKPEEYSGGADIDQQIKDGGKTSGSILYEIKNKIA